MPEENGQEAGQQQEQQEFKAPTSQAELDRIIGERLNREKAKFADYDDLKAKAAKFDEVEQASKTELQKAQEAAQAAERRAVKAEGAALRTQVAASKGVPAGALSGSTKEELEAAADALLAWRGEKKTTKPDLKDLRSGSKGDEDAGLTGKERAAAALRQLRGTN